MKFLKLSLAASVALGALSTSSFAQPLEEAIKGVDVSGYLRYRYTDDRYNKNKFGISGRGSAAHQWRAVADFKTPSVNNVALNLGVWYQNANNVNHGKGNATVPFVGNNLGAGADTGFGVRSFYATITPDNTSTTVLIGKQPLDTPVTNAYDGDRGTGILVLNSDVPNLTLAAAAFDSWIVNEASNSNSNPSTNPENAGVQAVNLNSNNNSIAKNLYGVAGIYNLDTDYGNFGGQLWGFYIDDAVDALVFGELSWKNSLLRAKAQYTYASLDNDSDSIFATYYGQVNDRKNHADIKKSNDVLVLEVGANLAQDYQIPLDVRLGYITNFADGTAVALEDEGTNVSRAGKIWWGNTATGISTSALRGYGVQGIDTDQSINVFYAAANYGFIDNRLNLGLEFANGENKLSNSSGSAKIKFTEITPTIKWKHNKNLTVSSYYAYLKTDLDDPNTEDQKRGRFRVEAKYSF
ncbi:major outer membrane protein [Helicobacter mesocricetorum]|uniref:major outer membrane protein n=1 Tax=Helicobacter mesocricetorum TaxID=87012 RepID=UPI000CF13B5B|nr:major outer membrane protein [Helicobacter mesocricetorum]